MLEKEAPPMLTHAKYIGASFVGGDMVGKLVAMLASPHIGFPMCPSRFWPCHRWDPRPPLVVCGGIVSWREIYINRKRSNDKAQPMI